MHLVLSITRTMHVIYLIKHVLLNDLKVNNTSSFQDLAFRGIGANYSGNKFASVYGDLVTEYFNQETKGTAGPFRQGYSTDTARTNEWVNTVHIHAKLRMAMRNKINIKTSSTHKELTDRAKKNDHKENVTFLKDALKSYNTNPFDEGPAKGFTTGVELNSKVIKGLLKAPTLGYDKFLCFVNSRLIEQTKSMYATIKRQVENAVRLEEAFSYPITSLPLSIAH